MNRTYKLFRIYTVTAILVMCILLLVTGVLTVKYNSETMVFGTEHSVLQVFKTQNRTLINVSGKIIDYEPETIKKYLTLQSIAKVLYLLHFLEFAVVDRYPMCS